MASAVADAASISLYFDVPHNEAVTLQSMARAALAWDSLIGLSPWISSRFE
jgi:hypothetical protein